MNWLYRFMYGRYGADQLTFALIILYLILSLTLTLIPVPLIWLLAYIPMVFCFYRMLSRNIAKRQAENWAFLRVWNPVKNWGDETLWNTTIMTVKNSMFYSMILCHKKKIYI